MKIVRICWNTNNWQMPSGYQGKSLAKNSYEKDNGYGHEEWLFDFSKPINGYHYSFLQPIERGVKNNRGKTYNIRLFSINSENRMRYFIGEINNLEVLEIEQSIEAFLIYKKNEWIKEMAEDLKKVKANHKKFDKFKLSNKYSGVFFNVRFKEEDVYIYPEPILIESGSEHFPNQRYNLQNSKDNFKKLLDSVMPATIELPSESSNNLSKTGPGKRHRGQPTTNVDYKHIEIQCDIYDQLNKKGIKVKTEFPIGNGRRLDLIAVDSQEEVTFYEVKVGKSLMHLLREGIGQLIEYAYFQKSVKAKKLVIVSTLDIDENTENYLKTIREKLKLQIFYQKFNEAKSVLEDKLY